MIKIFQNLHLFFFIKGIYLFFIVVVAAIDLDSFSKNLDANVLQENIIHITFCDISSEIVSNPLKLIDYLSNTKYN